ncbi:protein cordon-bleu isoform X1 [Clarias gariepinus]|uniref:protein cordon-bleu isoform X1 n=1 Tax=Clarias gariepinus TaxID=13013 RepID=UPI00234DC521|nr:protein cordon-bleu isoform X1 [Clarias gariepinus]XP_053354933.1 protein cordon-bleu isoform X1 [Clarias gariepinus]XP_053354934.1 protein cordon-bleu isoform X1 [Clarias gariepinus]
MEQEDLTERDLTLTVLLPEGREKTVTVHGSKPVMDVLVILCARYRLNPSDHVIELFSTNHNKLKFKPSSLIGSLEAELVVLKPKRSDVRKTPNVPVATVRLMINYRKSHKAVVRVSPRVPLAELMPVVCEKCEMDPNTTVLLRDGQSEEPLDLTKTLNDYGIRDVYVKAVSSSPPAPATPTAEDGEKDKLVTQDKVLEEKENRGFLSLFRRSKKSAEKNSNTISAPTSLVLKDPPVKNTANSTSSTESSEMPKKRRAPQPPSMPGSQGVTSEPSANQKATLPSSDNEKQGVLSRLSSTEASLKKNKRRAPPPPATSPSLPDSSDKEDDSNEDQSCSSVPSSPLMTEVLAEFNGRMKSMDHGDIWFDWSVTSSPPASNLPPLSAPQESDPVVPPGCELLTHGSQRDGLTTFTVVPRRRPQCMRQYEVLLTLETLETINGDTEGNLELGVLESREVEKIEKVEQFETNEAFENVVETNKEMGIADPFEKLNLNTDAEKEQSEDGDELEVHEQGDWIEEYRKRRRKFLMHDDGKEPRSLMISSKVFNKETVDDAGPSLPTKLSVCWEEDDTEEQNLEEIGSFVKEETREDKAAKIFTVQTPNPSRSDPQRDPTFNPAYTQDPYWDVKLSSNTSPSDSDTPFTSSANHSGIHNHQPLPDEPTSPQVSKSEPDPSFKHSPPSSVSRFALAVSQRVQSLGNGVCPLIPSARKTTSHPQSLGSRQTSSQKLYSQNLISEESMSKNPCNKAPPISDDPPFVSMSPQARRRAWSSFSRTQLKNLEQK